MTGENFPSSISAQERPAKLTSSLLDKLQRAVDDGMKDQRGAVLVLDLDSGRMLAQDRSLGGVRMREAPGSAIKPFVLLALLESGKVKPDEAILCPIELHIGKRQLNCSHPRMAEPMQATTALAYSCNFYFAQMALRLTNEELRQALLRSGVTAGISLGEVPGMLRTPANDQQRQLMALGIENIRVTPMGMLVGYRMLALLRKQTEKTLPAREAVFAGLEASASYGMGTLAQTAGMEVAGKTGTSKADGGWTHAWFAGYAPAKAPEIVVVVFLEQGRGGPDAAPVAGRIFAAYATARGLP